MIPLVKGNIDPKDQIMPAIEQILYDKYAVNSNAVTKMDEAYTIHNTTLPDVDGTVKKILAIDYVKDELQGWVRKKARWSEILALTAASFVMNWARLARGATFLLLDTVQQ